MNMYAANRKDLIGLIMIYLSFISVLWGADALNISYTIQINQFTAEIITVFLAFILVPVLYLLFQTPVEEQSIRLFENVPQVAGLSVLVMIPVTFISFPMVSGLGLDVYGWMGGSIIGAFHLAAVPLLCLILWKFHGQSNDLISSSGILSILLFYIIAVILVVFVHRVDETVAKVLFSLFFIGMSEEFLFRGVFQGRLNQLFGKPYRILRFNFGWGWIISALLFGLSHVIAPGDPGIWAWGFWTFCAGLAFGVIREQSGSFIASGIIHGIIMVFPVFFT